MVEARLSERAQKIYQTSLDPTCPPKPWRRWIRQQTLADELGCSRRSIGRALKELKAAGLLIDLNKRHENRCKLYEVKIPLNPPFPPFAKATGDTSKKEENTPAQRGEEQLRFYRFTFESNFRDWPDWEKFYTQVTWELRHETSPDRLFRQTFDKLYEIRDTEMALKAIG